MAETKYGKYILTQPKPVRTFDGKPEPQDGPDVKTSIVYLDGTVLPGGLYTDCWWFRKPTRYSSWLAHTHDFDEVLAFMGSDPENPCDLGGEIEFFLGDERHILTKSCMIFVPRGLQHCPMKILRVDRPVFHFSTGNTTSYKRL